MIQQVGLHLAPGKQLKTGREVEEILGISFGFHGVDLGHYYKLNLKFRAGK